MPNDPKEGGEYAKRLRAVSAAPKPMQSLVETEALVRARVLVDQIRLSRLATQNAIMRSRKSLAETRAALVVMKHAHLSRVRRKVQRRIDALKPPTKAS
jgi:hypothetical protein